MPPLQKITRPTVRILGTEYSSRLVGLHNRVRMHANRLLVYKDMAGRRSPTPRHASGYFVPEQRRLVIYLRRGAPEITVAHELVHAMLHAEGYLPLRCRKDDLGKHPAIGRLAAAVNDLVIHPVVLDRLDRMGYPAPGGETRIAPRPGAGDRPHRLPAPSADPVISLARTVAVAEAIHRVPAADAAVMLRVLDDVRSGLGALAKEIAGLAPWDPGRSPLDARVIAAALSRRLDRAGSDLWPDGDRLAGRLLIPACLTSRRLASPAGALFEALRPADDSPVVVITFRPDGAACTARAYADAESAARVLERVRHDIASMSVAQLVARHRLEFLLIRGGRRYSPVTGGRPTEGEALYARAARRAPGERRAKARLDHDGIIRPR